MGLPLLPAPMRNSADFRGIGAVRRIVKDHRIQVINSHGSKDSWICFPPFMTGVPLVRTRHITDPVRPGFWRSFGYRHGCSVVIATSACIREALIRDNKVNPKRIEIIGEFVDLERFKPGVVDGASFRDEFKVPAEAPLLVIVGMIRSEKGHTTFLKAALRVIKSHPQARFAIVGEGTGPRALEHKCADILRTAFGAEDLRYTPVFMAGYRSDVRDAMAAADVIVVPWHAEAQSRVVPEAFAMGRAVIASDVGGLPDIVKHNETGLLVPPRDDARLAEAMIALIDDPARRAQLAAGVRSFAEKHLSIDARMEETVAMYRRLISRR